MGTVVRLDRMLLMFLVLRAIPCQNFETSDPENRQINIGPFFGYKERTQWQRSFWLQLPLSARQKCPAIGPKTLKFYEARKISIDIDVRALNGDPYIAARTITRLTLGNSASIAGRPSII